MQEEVSRLIETLLQTSQRLEELTGGEVDSVADQSGRTFLLQRAQEQLRHSEATKQSAIFNALPAHIALLDTHGVILSVNETWRQFAGANGLLSPRFGVDTNYLAICDEAQGDFSAEAARVAAGIRSVLECREASFSVEYPCPSPTQPRWFLMTATPLGCDHPIGAVIMHVDITARKQAEDAFQQFARKTERRERMLTTMLSAISDFTYIFDLDGRFLFVNQSLLQIWGITLEEAVGRTYRDLGYPEELAKRLQQQLERVIATRETVKDEAYYTYPSAVEGHYEYILSPVIGADGTVEFVVGSTRDVTERNRAANDLRASKAEMTYSAQHDFLTGLPNRMLLHDRIDRAIAAAPRHHSRVAVLFLDLDGFKHINDSLGHTVGDKLLQSVARRLEGCVRSSDTVSRQGGDEFVVLLSEAEQWEDAAIIAKRMLVAVAQTHFIDALQLHLTTSIGISLYPEDGMDVETLIKNADISMYQAKENGRHSYQFFKPEMNARAVERQSIDADLRRALERQEFSLHYQPKIDLKTSAITGVEALIRWNHPTRGQVPPGKFIRIAEESGMILEIGHWVLREACAQASKWLAAGLPPVTMAVNVSATQLCQEGFLQGVLAILKDTGLATRSLELELTETVLMKHVESTASILQLLRETGVKVSVDDFGTGYSSLSYLRKFPIDVLKIDQSFIRQINTEDGNAIVTAVISMARSLKLRVLAEGVETREQLEYLKRSQCDEAQGYYFSRPIPAQQFAAMLASAGRPGALPLAS